MQDTALKLPTKINISCCYTVKSIGEEIKCILDLSILDANGNACPVCCYNGCGKAVVKKGPIFVKLNIVKIKPPQKNQVWDSFLISAKIVTDMTNVKIDKHGQPILTDDDLKNADFLSPGSLTILMENNYNSRIVVVVFLEKKINSVPVLCNDSDGSDDGYVYVTYTRFRRSEINTSLMLHIVENTVENTVENDVIFKKIARDILFPTKDSDSDSDKDSDKDSDSDSDSDSGSDLNSDLDSDSDKDSEDAEDAKDAEDTEDMKDEDSENAENADDADDANDADDAEDAEDIKDKDMEDIKDID